MENSNKQNQQNKSHSDETNVYIEELKKCVGQPVTVFDISGKEFSGICKAISFMHLNVILMTDDEKIIIKNISHIKRKRSFVTPAEKEAKFKKK